jgi:hypothetical protein
MVQPKEPSSRSTQLSERDSLYLASRTGYCEEVKYRYSMLERSLLGVTALFFSTALACTGGNVAPAADTFQPRVDTTPPPRIICPASKTFCEGNTLWSCSEDGTQLEGLQCPATCENSKCTQQCVPNATVCTTPDNLVVCSPAGLPTVVFCDYGCEDGECIETLSCEPGETKCDPNPPSIIQCNAKGTGYDVIETCPVTCDQATTSCVDTICQPGDTRCSPTEPTTIQVCNDAQTTWTYLKSCPKLCLEGECVDVLCTLGEVKCTDAGIVECLNEQQGFVEKESCPHMCYQDADGVPVCGLCNQGTTQCNGSIVEYCDSALEGWLPYLQCGELQVCENGACKNVLVLEANAPIQAHYLKLTKGFVDCWNDGNIGVCFELRTLGLLYPISHTDISDWFCDSAKKSDFADEENYDVANDIMGCGAFNVEDMDFKIDAINPGLDGVECVAFSDGGVLNSKEIILDLCETLESN